MIRKIKWKNHLILGNLELDFEKEDGSIYSTIVIAGENGSGKTTILDTMATFLSLGEIMPFDYIDYDIDGESYHIFYDNDNDGEMGFHKRVKLPDGKAERIRTNRNNNKKVLEQDNEDLRSHGVIYSRAKSGFRTGQIKNASTQQIDENKYDVDLGEDYTSVKQLLVDLRVQDSTKFMNMMESGSNFSIEDFKKTESKLFRFTKAFDGFFDNLRFNKIDDELLDEKRVLFEKFGKEILIDNLSTGEKQIVFRGVQLLRNLNAVNEGTIFVDEPELSMHPKWQEKILDYYISMFEGKGNQLIFATHSEYVLKSALQKKDEVLVIVLENNNGQIRSSRIITPKVLANLTFAETNNVAFGVYSNDYHIELYGYLQYKEGLDTVKETDDFIKKSGVYNMALHQKKSSYTNPKTHKTTSYETLPTFIRNAIDHPNNGNTFTEEELKISTDLLIQLC